MQKFSDSLEAILVILGLTFFAVIIYRSAGDAQKRHQPYQVAAPAIVMGSSPYLHFQAASKPESRRVAPSNLSRATASVAAKSNVSTRAAGPQAPILVPESGAQSVPGTRISTVPDKPLQHMVTQLPVGDISQDISSGSKQVLHKANSLMPGILSTLGL